MVVIHNCLMKLKTQKIKSKAKVSIKVEVPVEAISGGLLKGDIFNRSRHP